MRRFTTVPSVTTSATGLPSSCAMCPSIENTTKPAKILVRELLMVMMNESLPEKTRKSMRTVIGPRPTNNDGY